MKNVAGYLIFIGYLSLACVFYFAKPTDTGPHILCGGHNQTQYGSPRNEDLSPAIIPKRIDEAGKPRPQGATSLNDSPRRAHC